MEGGTIRARRERKGRESSEGSERESDAIRSAEGACRTLPGHGEEREGRQQ